MRNAADYQDNVHAISASLRLGVEVESEDPNIGPMIKALTRDQLDWIAAWLAGEGFGQLPDSQG